MAPSSERVAVQIGKAVSMSDAKDIELDAEPDGYHSGFVLGQRPECTTATALLQARFQIQPHVSNLKGLTGHRGLLIRRSSNGRTIRGRSHAPGQVIYELHIGTFTRLAHSAGQQRNSNTSAILA
jgi:1,4-alpha-glucan branching enzyme